MQQGRFAGGLGVAVCLGTGLAACGEDGGAAAEVMPDSGSEVTAEAETTAPAEGEYWQIQGTGHAYTDGTHIVDDGSTLSFAFRYGAGADADLVGTTRLYYNPNHSAGWTNGIRPATNGSAETSHAALAHFTPSASGIKVICDQKNPDQCTASDAYYINASQAVPLASKAVVRLFFEARDMAVKPGPNQMSPTQIYALDSQDGYRGEDFNTGTSSICGGVQSTDFAPGGACALTLVVAASEATGLSEVRQFKIGFATLTSWLWDEAPGTFMVITGADRCGTTNDGLFYAVYDGAAWNVAKDAGGCAKSLVPYAHGPVVVNVGAGRYKLYYEDIMSNVPVGSVTKPLRFLTADAARTGAPTVVDFEDWDLPSEAGEVHFRWPDGTALTDDEESGLGDHFVYVPDGLGSEVMFLNLGGFDNRAAPHESHGLGMAIPVAP